MQKDTEHSERARYIYNDMNKRLVPIAFLSFLTGISQAQVMTGSTSEAESEADIVYPLKDVPGGIAPYGTGFYYYNGGDLLNMMNRRIASGQEFTNLAVSPDGSTYTIVERRPGKPFRLRVREMWKGGKDRARTESADSVVSLGYSHDASRLYVAAKGGRLSSLSAVNLAAGDTITLAAEPTGLSVSPDGRLIAVAEGNRLELISPRTLSRTRMLDFRTPVRDVAFSQDGSRMAVICGGGEGNLYDTSDFSELKHWTALGDARGCYFHPEGKYVAVITGDNRIALVNMLNDRDRRYVDSVKQGVGDVWFMPDVEKGVYLVYSTPDAIVYHPVFTLSPNRMKLLNEEVGMRMKEWMQRMPDESLEDYNARIGNEELVMQQMQLFETEIATRMAGDMLAMSEISFGDYNPGMEMLSLSFDNLPNIYLSVPQNEIGSFMDPANLEFRNQKYYINGNDEFELVYTEVYNRANGKTYVFDNAERKSLEYLESEDGFMPLEQMQAAVMEEVLLEDIKNDVLGRQGASAVSDHTHITVSTAVVGDDSRSDRKGGNYEVTVSYTVDEAYSAKDDFGPGKYALSDSKAAMAMLDILKQAFESRFSRYLRTGKRVRVTLIGSADATPVRRPIPYDGIYGQYTDAPVDVNGRETRISVTDASGIRTNEQLAFIRAMGVKDFITTNIPAFNRMDASYGTDITVSEEKGAEYRRIGVRFVFVDAFE